MKTIVGRFADLSLNELLRLLATASAAGELWVGNSAGQAQLRIAAGMVEGEVSPVMLAAYHRREGSFRFQPANLTAETAWQPMEEFLLRLASEAPAVETKGADALSELRESLVDVSPAAGGKVLVVTADPRPYKSLEVEWARRGWEVRLQAEPRWPRESAWDVAVFHLPGSATLAGQGNLWLDLLSHASRCQPPVPVVWVGGLADAFLRHEAVQRGAAFLLPAPAGEVGEAARWFRQDLTLLVERLLQRRGELATPSSAFQEFFLALHADSVPEEARASLLRLAAAHFSRGLLLACSDQGFEVLGGFGCGALPRRLPRGLEGLEEVVARGQMLEVPLSHPALAFLAGEQASARGFPITLRGSVAGILLAADPRGATDPQELAAVAVRVGPLLGL